MINNEEALYDAFANILRTQDSSRFEKGTRETTDGRKIKTLVTKVTDLKFTIEDKLDQGVGFYLQVHSIKDKKLIASYLKVHKEDSLYNEIAKKVYS